MAEYADDIQSQLDAVAELLASNDLEQAWIFLEKLDHQFPDSPDVQAMMGDAFMQEGDLEQALEAYDRTIELDPDWSDGLSARADCLVELGHVEEAAADVDKALKLDDQNPQAHWVMGILLELDGKFAESDEAYREAEQLDPEAFPVPVRVTRRAFDLAVKKAIARLPPDFKARMDGVDIYVKDLPEPTDHPDSGLGPLILGAFDGYMMTERRESDPWTQVPPRICLYQRNIERVCRTKDDLVKEIEITILHEVGHFFGLEDEDLQRLDLG